MWHRPVGPAGVPPAVSHTAGGTPAGPTAGTAVPQPLDRALDRKLTGKRLAAMTTPECLLVPSANRQKSLRRGLREIRFRIAVMIVAAILSLGSRLASVAAPAAPASAEPAPSAVLDPAAWTVAG